jgi:intracellular septation protein
MKALLDLAPTLVFFGAYLSSGIYAATIALMLASVALVAIYRLRDGRWHGQHLVTALIAGVFGGLTLYFHNENFIKIKPTALYAAFAVALLGSQLIGDKVLMQRMGHKAIDLPTAIWRRVNLAWALFFTFLAVLNLFVAYRFSLDTWVKFKTFGFTGLMIAFMVGHAPFFSRYMPREEAGDA